jgi:hypothetical protein
MWPAAGGSDLRGSSISTPWRRSLEWLHDDSMTRHASLVAAAALSLEGWSHGQTQLPAAAPHGPSAEPSPAPSLNWLPGQWRAEADKETPQLEFAWTKTPAGLHGELAGLMLEEAARGEPQPASAPAATAAAPSRGLDVLAWLIGRWQGISPYPPRWELTWWRDAGGVHGALDRIAADRTKVTTTTYLVSEELGHLALRVSRFPEESPPPDRVKELDRVEKGNHPRSRDRPAPPAPQPTITSFKAPRPEPSERSLSFGRIDRRKPGVVQIEIRLQDDHLLVLERRRPGLRRWDTAEYVRGSSASPEPSPSPPPRSPNPD